MNAQKGGLVDDALHVGNIEINEVELDELLKDVNSSMGNFTNEYDQFTNALDVDDAFNIFTGDFLDSFTDCKSLTKIDEIPLDVSIRPKSRYPSSEMRSSVSEPVLKRKLPDSDTRELKRRPYEVTASLSSSDDYFIDSNEITRSESTKSFSLSSSNEYCDFSNLTEEEVADVVGEFYSCNGKDNSKVTFPMKLHTIIERSEVDGYSSIISWQPHGRAFKIHDQKLLLKNVISRFFYQSNIQSFFRQLKIYGFQKMAGKGSQDKGAYFHELFLRGKPGLCSKMIRFKSRPVDEPNFLNIPPLPVAYGNSDKSLSNQDQDSNASPCTNRLRPIHYVNSSSKVEEIDNNVGKSFPSVLSDSYLHALANATPMNNGFQILHDTSYTKNNSIKVSSVVSNENILSEGRFPMEVSSNVFSSSKSKSVPADLPLISLETADPSSSSQTSEYNFLTPCSKTMSYIFQRGFKI